MSHAPCPRGPLSAAVLAALHAAPGALSPDGLPSIDVGAPLADDDVQLALYCCYELHYRGFDDVDERWEWDPGLLALRARLEDVFERALAEALAGWAPPR